MKINDAIYGEHKIEPIIEQLINTKEMQRLKKIHQGGASYLVNPMWNVTRYEHSVGTMLFIKRVGGSIEEQIAGLLHDISHTAFSHVIDLAFNNEDEDYHEKIYEKIINTSSIPSILSDNGYDYIDILFNEKQWTILEQAAPRLCADRIDYTLRDMYHYGYIKRSEIEQFLNSLELIKGEVIIHSIEVAEWFVEIYYKEVIGFFLDPLNVYAYDRLSKAIKLSLERNEISLEDLMKDDDHVFRLLINSKCDEVVSLINSINYSVKVVENRSDYDIFQKQKIRSIDPQLKVGNMIYASSEKSEKVKRLTENAIKQAMEGKYIKIVH